MNRTQVSISYSHKDAAWLESLQVHLRPLELEGLIDWWDNTWIKAGEADGAAIIIPVTLNQLLLNKLLIGLQRLEIPPLSEYFAPMEYS